MNGTLRCFRICSLALTVGLSALLARGQTAEPNNSVYEMFVRSFATSVPGHCGNLAGATAKLDYLNNGTGDSLGVGIVWLMPIFPTTTYHGYDVTDYRAVNPEYGSLDDLKAFVAAAHAHHIRVILDIPFNHTSFKHPWFTEAIENAQSPYRSWYIIQPDDGNVPDHWHTVTNSHGEKLKYFGLFSDEMPDLNFDNPDVRKKIKAIAKFWLDLGVDGFRLDAAKHMYGWTFDPNEEETKKNVDWWAEFSDSVRSVKPDAIMVGEVLGSDTVLAKYARSLDLLIDESFMNNTRNEAMHPSDGYLGKWNTFLTSARQANTRGTYESFAFIASHDRNPRFESDLEQNGGSDLDAKYRLAMSIVFSAGNYPVLYQGDELKQRGVKWPGNPPPDGDGSRVYDETLRESFPWHAVNAGADQATWQPKGQPHFLPKYEKDNDGISVEEETGDAASMLKFVRALSALRAEEPALANGEIGEILTDSTDWIVFDKAKASDKVVVLINPTNHSNNYQFNASFHPEYSHAKLLFWSDGTLRKWEDTTSHPTDTNGSVLVGPYGIVVVQP